MENILLKNINPSMPVIVAVSTGPDSMALLNVLLNKGFQVVIAHVNHHKREQSLIEQVRLSYFAKRHHIQIEIGHFYFENGNFHHEAHLFRQQFFVETAKKHHTNQVVLGHHLDDQLETLLMNMMKFEYITEASFIKPINFIDDIAFIRPMLNVQKSDIYSYLEKEGIFFYEDFSNQQDNSTRNHIRNSVLPSLYNHYSKTKWIRLLEVFTSINMHINQKVKDLGQPSVDDLNKLPLLIKRLYIRHFINKTTNYDVEISSKQLDDIIGMIQTSNSNQSLDLGHGYQFKRFYNNIDVVSSDIQTYSPVQLSLNKSFKINENTYYLEIKKTHILHKDTLKLCYNAKGCSLELRTRRQGDVIRLNYGTKKIKDLFIDEKIPLHKRDQILMIAQGNNIVYIPDLKRKAFCGSNEDFIYIIKEN